MSCCCCKPKPGHILEKIAARNAIWEQKRQQALMLDMQIQMSRIAREEMEAIRRPFGIVVNAD